MDVLHLIDRLEELVAEARRMPIGQGVVVDRRRILELVDQMRSSVPWEVKQAQDIVAEKEAIIEEARREGDGIIARAEMDAAGHARRHRIVKAPSARPRTSRARRAARADPARRDAGNVTAKLRQAENAATQPDGRSRPLRPRDAAAPRSAAKRLQLHGPSAASAPSRTVRSTRSRSPTNSRTTCKSSSSNPPSCLADGFSPQCYLKALSVPVFPLSLV